MHDCARRILLAVVIAFAATMPAFAESVTLLRVFLNDGTAIVSYGEYARVGDRLIFSMPVGNVEAEAPNGPSLHVVNLPVSAVNWAATEKYAESARYSHYMATSAESDYSSLAGEVAAVLNRIVATKDAKARLTMAVDARRRLASWPREHYGYRANDVREMLGMLDEAISDLRLAAGETSFAIDLIATPPQPPAPDRVPLMRAPTPAEAIAQAIAVAKATDVPSDRISILRTVISAIDNPQNGLTARWGRPTREWALDTIDEELNVGKAYAAMSGTMLKRASAAAGRADVRGVQGVLEAIVRRDEKLGRRRPDEVNALIDQVRSHLDAARRLRLARDRWTERAGSFRAYTSAVTPVLSVMTRAQKTLDDIRNLAGSDAEVLARLGAQLASNVKSLNTMVVPDEVKPAHALLSTSVNLAETAVKMRRQAATTGEMQLAWDASSAASGSLMLLSKAKEDMEAAVRLPEIR
jgi:hypothetical protein